MKKYTKKYYKTIKGIKAHRKSRKNWRKTYLAIRNSFYIAICYGKVIVRNSIYKDEKRQ